ncbi:MAG: DoxX family membrane protein [Verrucomicrobia bacterium]|nr:DoxX family membrane protein [Verrucomicrobiota bacterium]MDA1066935.1 DoxX family membrane protein [Verrucomicrobiota bacterium]
MNKVTLVIRILLGLMLAVFGLNKFVHFLPALEMHGDAAVYMGGLAASKFTFPVIGIIEVGVGMGLLFNKYVPLALVLLAPISVNILLYHLILDLPNMAVGTVVFAFNLILLFANKKSYGSLLTA